MHIYSEFNSRGDVLYKEALVLDEGVLQVQHSTKELSFKRRIYISLSFLRLSIISRKHSFRVMNLKVKFWFMC